MTIFLEFFKQKTIFIHFKFKPDFNDLHLLQGNGRNLVGGVTPLGAGDVLSVLCLYYRDNRGGHWAVGGSALSHSDTPYFVQSAHSIHRALLQCVLYTRERERVKVVGTIGELAMVT